MKLTLLVLKHAIYSQIYAKLPIEPKQFNCKMLNNINIVMLQNLLEINTFLTNITPYHTLEFKRFFTTTQPYTRIYGL